MTGDIANSGKESEYEAALNLLSNLKDTLISYNNSLKIEFIIAPGNHDCNFDKTPTLRKLSIKSLNNGTLDIKEIDNETIESCTSIQQDFFDFREILENKKSINKQLSSNIFKRYDFLLGQHSISFNVYNLSWMSQRNEEQSKI